MSLLPFDILEEIFNHFDVEGSTNGRAPLFQALFVNKAVYRVALQCLWRYLSSPLPLIRLLPFVKDAGGTYVVDTLTPSSKLNWSSFNTHASLVVKIDYITFHPYPTSFPSLNYEAIFSHLLFLRPSASRLFTRLTEFQILFRTTPTKEELTLFSNAPSLERLELHSVNEYDPPDKRIYGIDEFVRGFTAGTNASLKHLILPRPTFQSSLHTLSNLEGSLRSLTLMWPCTELASERLGFGSSDTIFDSPEGNLQGTPSPWYPLDQIALEQLGSLVNLTLLDIDFSVVTGPNYRFPSASSSSTDFASTSIAPDSTLLLTSHSGISLPSLQHLTLKSYVPLATAFLFSLQHSSELRSLEIVSVLGELKDWEDLFGVVGSTWGAEDRLLHTLKCTDMHLVDTIPTRSLPSTDDRGPYSITSLLTPLFPLSSTLRNLTLRGFQFIHCSDSAVAEVLEGLSSLQQVAFPIPAPFTVTDHSGRRGSRTIERTADGMERPTWKTLVSISKGKIGKRLRGLEIALDTDAGMDSEMDLFHLDSRYRRTNNGLRNGILGRLEGRRPIRISSGRGTGKEFMWGYEYSGYEALGPYALLNGLMVKAGGNHSSLRRARHLHQRPASSSLPPLSPLPNVNVNHTTNMDPHPLRHLTILSSSLPSTHNFDDSSELIAVSLIHLFPMLDSVEGKEYTASYAAFTSESIPVLRNDSHPRAHDRYKEQWIKIGELVGIFSRGEYSHSL
ncbi:hypothetical protein VKT23_018558 [Stygiomarasmius scandens]|uniref:F-box domain-containing protein n=1 Tax=Marasmiellus scandens TaxID=2682957 RepID=A0ABR1IRS6_9AGAR